MDGRVLFISPHSDHAGALAQMLEPVTIDCEYVASYQEARCRLENDVYDAILTEATITGLFSLGSGHPLASLHSSRYFVSSCATATSDLLP